MPASAALPLHHAACLNHAGREAVARCPSCSRYFCRECITEHGGRMLCSACFQALTKVQEKPVRDWFILTTSVQALLGLGLLWFSTWLLGRVLLNIPTAFHEGYMWERLGL
jgi:hypothetical protein